MRRLTKQEIKELPEGAKVYVRWSGGNGPHWYEVGKHFDCTTILSCSRLSKGLFVGFPSEAEYIEIENDLGGSHEEVQSANV